MREAAASHHARFQQAFVGWRWPDRAQQKFSGADVAAALEKWLAQYPEHAQTIQMIALGANYNAIAIADWDGGRRIAEVGLNATLLGALGSQERLVSAALLGLLAGRSALELGGLLAARMAIERASELLERVEAHSPLKSYLQLQRHLLSGMLAEASLEISIAAENYERALEIIVPISGSRRRARELETLWMNLVFGRAPDETSDPVWEQELSTAHRRAQLGLGRCSKGVESAREAVQFCVAHGLPVLDTALALQGVISKLPAHEIDGAVDALLKLAGQLDASYRPVWATTLRCLQAEAHLEKGDQPAAERSMNAAVPADLSSVDGITFVKMLATRARIFKSTRVVVEVLLSAHAQMALQLTGTALLLRWQAALEPALNVLAGHALAALKRDSAETTRARASVLLDALRASETIPQFQNPVSAEVQAAMQAAADRLGRLCAAIATGGSLAETLVLIIQRVGEVSVFTCVGGDAGQPLAVAAAEVAANAALEELMLSTERALVEDTADIDMESAGRKAFDALPSLVRARMLRAHTLIVVPDFAAGQDRMPVELLHDGAQFIGLSKVVSRCLSISHVLRVLEAPLTPPLQGRRALCAAIADPPGLPALKFAREEMESVSRALRGAMWNVPALRESDADPKAILELAPLANILHIACHGEASAGAEALVLADGARLSAADIATRHRLRGFVYLNACSLAQGRYLGGGVSRGVAYAFIKAGAPCVVANLLPVEDQGAALLSEAFYAAAVDRSVGEAMRLARLKLQGQVSIALLTATVLIGDPFVKLGEGAEARADSTSKLIRGEPVPAQLPTMDEPSAKTDSDPRFAAAVGFAHALSTASDAELPILAQVARDIGHDIGEAHCWLVLAERERAAEGAASAETLQSVVAKLDSLRGAWAPAHELHRTAQTELRALDPAFVPRTLKSVHLPSGLSINDRSDPAVNALLSMVEAQQQHEEHWRGEPVLRAPDLDAASIAHNAVMWGYLNRVYDSGAEAGVGSAFAARAAWRGVVREDSVPHLARITTGLLCFLWGQQKVQHLEHWMANAHRDVIAIAIDRVNRFWTPPEQSPALQAARDIAAALGKLVVPNSGGSKFARARAAMSSTDSVGDRLEQVRAEIEASIAKLRSVDPYASADLGAWVLGELLLRTSAARSGPDAQQELAIACTSLYDKLRAHEEGWFMPYLMDGFKETRDSGGRDLFAQWSDAVL